MKRPLKSDLANIRVDYFKDSENGISEEFIIDSYVDEDANEIIDIYKLNGQKWVQAPEDLSDDELDSICERSLQKFLDRVEFESSKFNSFLGE
jgi:hypothetical protein